MNWPAVLARKEKIVNKHAKGIEFLFRKNKVEIAAGLGPMGWAGARGGRKGRADHRSRGHEHHVCHRLRGAFAAGRGIRRAGDRGNRDILKLPRVPKSLVVVGAGAVGVEFASIFRSFGTDVTVIEMLPRMVPLEDEDISAELEKAFRKRGVRDLHRGESRVGDQE